MYNVVMNFVLTALQDRPQGLFQMDDTSPLQDYSGYNRVATATGSPVEHAALVAGASYAPVLGTYLPTYDVPVFKLPSESFTLSAWVKQTSGTGEQQILGHTGQYDGLTINGTIVSFVTKYTAATEARCSFDLQTSRAVFVVGVHTEEKNSLYVNGELVSEVLLNDTQKSASFVTGNVTSGETAGTSRMAVNNVAYYAYALSGDVVKRQYLAGMSVPPPDEVVVNSGGDYMPVSVEAFDTFLNQTWDTEEEWEAGQLQNVVVVDEQLVPQFDGDTSMPGSWLTSFDIESSNVTSIYGVNLNWDGEGATVQTSLDGTTWATATRGANIAAIPAGFNPTGKVLQVKVSFPGGIVNDESYLDHLNVVGFTTGTTRESDGRTLAYTLSHPESEYPHLEYHDNWGVDIKSGGSVVISADALESLPARTLEVWIKRNGNTPSISLTGDYYQNGILATSTLPDLSWVLLHVVAAADITGTITINGPAQIGHIGVYDTALTATQIANIYNAYVGRSVASVPDSSVLAITQVTNAAQIYAHDWSIQGAG